MQHCTIFHVSTGRKFPLDLRETGHFKVSVEEVELSKLGDVHPPVGDFAVFFVQGEHDQGSNVWKILKTHRSLADFPKLVLLPESDCRALQKDFNLVPHSYLIDDTIAPRHLKTVFELVFQQEYYRQVVYNMAREMRQKGSAFENLLDLARKELQVSRDASGAYASLLEYEASMRKFEEQIQRAKDMAIQLKEQEMLLLKEQLQATERLSEYRDKELDVARSSFTAAEAALDLSRIENMERERIITAMDRLRSFTDKELLDLFQENQELRRKLGMPPRQ